jgi:hypothetical protein
MDSNIVHEPPLEMDRNSEGDPSAQPNAPVSEVGVVDGESHSFSL